MCPWGPGEWYGAGIAGGGPWPGGGRMEPCGGGGVGGGVA